MNFLIHRGTKEIGGSCVEINTDTTRIVIDIGMPLVNADHTSFDPLKTENASTEELIRNKILPDIPVLYNKEQDKTTALIISHAHQDHYGFLKFVNKNIPLYMGEVTHKLIELSSAFSGKPDPVGKKVYFKSRESFKIGDIEITPYLMDHAAPDAYAFLIRTDTGSLFYTGDFRSHGRKSIVFNKFIARPPENIDYLLMEGTCLSRDIKPFKSENALESDFVKTFKDTKGINLVNVSGQNIDRLVTIYRACIRCNKLFVIDFYIANILNDLAALGYKIPYPSPDWPKVKVFFPGGLSNRMAKMGKKKNFMYPFTKFKITIEEINEQMDNIVMPVRSSMGDDIAKIKNISGSTLVYSMWDGYKNNKATEYFLNTLSKRGVNIIDIHTSGHADRATLIKMVNAIKPKYLIPIHTFEAGKYKEIFTNTQVKMLDDRELLSVNEKERIEPPIVQPELKLWDQIVKVGEAHEELHGLPETLFDKLKPYLTYICNKLNISESQAVLFSDLFYLNEGEDISIRSLADFMACKSVNIFKLFDDFVALEEKELIVIESENNYRGQRVINFSIPLETVNAIRNDSSPESTNKKNLSNDGFLSAIYELCENCISRGVSFKRTIRNMDRLFENNRHLKFIKILGDYGISKENQFILLRFCHYFVNFDTDEMDLDNIERVYDSHSEFNTEKRQLKAGNHILQQKKIIENVMKDGFGQAENFRLTEKAKEELLSDFQEQLTPKTLHGLISVDSIPEKQLFYPEKTAGKIAELTDLLKEDNFPAVQKRLLENGKRIGFACLFSGGPGTGKTETVYQIAKKTGRAIMKVDISETKSMWFGQSEKLIKDLFDRYRNTVKYSKPVPILLFNEADAIIGRRQNIGADHNGPAQTENAIQNIILEEIENLNGILIATTNLTQNMDSAFERRFLYKIDFEKPTLEARISIWQSLISDMTKNDAQTLASKFEFSGGQIENIARRRTIAKLLYGENPALETMLQYCREEHEEKQETTIGFNAS